MPALTRMIKRGMSNSSFNGTSSGRQNHKNLGRTLSTPEACTSYKFEDFYRISCRLSKGSFGVVYVAEHLVSGQEYAVKVIERAKLSEKEKTSVQREVSILKDCGDVENIVQLVDYFVAPEFFYVVQVYAKGGDVFERLAQRTSYTEADARDLAKYLLQTMEVLHSRKVAHRDLKPENLLLKDMLDDTSIVVADFGFAAYVPAGGLKTRCGTPAFVGPEVLLPNCRYDERVDMWSVGCLLYMLIAGYPPFQHRDHRGLFKKVRGADYVFHETYWHNVSLAAKRLIASLLTVEPKFRCTARQALDTSEWLKLDAEELRAHDLAASLGEIKKFHSRRTLMGAMHAVVGGMRTKAKSAGDAQFCDHIDDEWSSNDTDANLNEDDAPSRDHLVKETSDSILLSTSRPSASFYDMYETRELIHSGQTAKVYECVKRGTREVYAVKIISRKAKSRKSVTGRTTAETVLHEVAVLDQFRHDNIIQINEFFEDVDHFYLLMERMRGGDVFDRLLRLTRYSEADAQVLAKRLVSAVAYFHKEGIVHRDLKPQVLLLKSEDDVTDIKITDFGFACRAREPQSLTTRCGTPSYVAPEVLKNVPYDQAVDMWSVGVILYVLLSGSPPFTDENQSELFRKIRMGEWTFDGKEEWKDISEEPKNLIRGLLVTNPGQRLTAEQALHCNWLKESKGDGKAALHDVRIAKLKLAGPQRQTAREAFDHRKSRLKNNSVRLTKGKPPPATPPREVDQHETKEALDQRKSRLKKTLRLTKGKSSLANPPGAEDKQNDETELEPFRQFEI